MVLLGKGVEMVLPTRSAFIAFYTLYLGEPFFAKNHLLEGGGNSDM